MKNTIYKIHVINWNKHNTGHKSTYKKIMIKANFCTDAKIRTLSMSERWVFLNLIVACSDVARDTVELSSKHIRDMLESNRNIDGVLDRLQSLQLVTYEKRLFNELNELNELKKRKEKKKEKEPLLRKGEPTKKAPPEINQESQNSLAPLGAAKVPTKPSPPDPGSLVNKQTAFVIAAYCQAFKARYNARPILGGKERGVIQRMLKDLPPEKLSAMLQVYLQMHDPWFDKKKHDLATFEQNLNKIAVSLQTGKDDRPEDPFSFLEDRKKSRSLEVL